MQLFVAVLVRLVVNRWAVGRSPFALVFIFNSASFYFW
jgi:hypothetical protein